MAMSLPEKEKKFCLSAVQWEVNAFTIPMLSQPLLSYTFCNETRRKAFFHNDRPPKHQRMHVRLK